MKIGKTNVMIHVGIVLLALGALIGLARSVFGPSSFPACSSRYTNVSAFRLERDGAILTPEDILARVGSDSTGVLGNLDVMRPRDPRFPAAMRVSLRPASLGSASSEVKAGISFPWHPRGVQSKSVACLSYFVFLTGEFDFYNGGVLPGIEGQSPERTDRFVTNLAWRQSGQVGVNVLVVENGETQTIRFDSLGFTVPRGQWAKLDQEIILNTPGKDDGILRVWVDGALAIEKKDVSYRAKPEVRVSGLAANVFYGTADASVWAPSDAKFYFSPFEISWD